VVVQASKSFEVEHLGADPEYLRRPLPVEVAKHVQVRLLNHLRGDSREVAATSGLTTSWARRAAIASARFPAAETVV
jgi:hypothetical protein